MRFLDSTVIVLATQAFGLAVVFVANLIISRVYGPTGKGALALMIAMAELVYALSHLAQGFTAQYFIGKNLAAPRRLVGNFLFYPLILGAALIALFALTYPVWHQWAESISAATILPAAALALILLVYEPICQTLIGAGKMIERAAVVMSQNVVIIVFVAVAALAVLSLSSLTWFYVISYAIAASIGVWLSRKHFGAPARPDWTLFKETMRYGGWIYVSNILATFITRIDFFILTAVAGIGAGGIYSVASGLTLPLVTLATSINTVFYPKTSAELDDTAATTTAFYFRQALIAQVPLLLLIAALGYPALWLYGPSFTAGYAPMLILMFAAALRSQNGILMLYILGRGHARVRPLVFILTSAVTAAVAYTLVEEWKLIGVASGAIIGALVENFVLRALFRRYSGDTALRLYRISVADAQIMRDSLLDFMKRARRRVSTSD